MNIWALGTVILGFVLLLIGLIIWLAQDDTEWYTIALLISGAILLVVGVILWFTLGKKGKGEDDEDSMEKKME